MVSNAAAVASPLLAATEFSSETRAAIDERADIVRTIRDRALRAKRVGANLTAGALISLADDLESEGLDLFGAFRCACEGACGRCIDGLVRVQ